MARLGMDVDTVERSSRSIVALQASVDSLILSLDRIVGEMGATWQGPDSQEFVQQRWPAFRSEIRSIGEALRTFGELALRNVAEQRSASDTLESAGTNAGGGGGGTSVRVDLDGDGSFDTVVIIDGGSIATHEWPDGFFRNARFTESAFSGGRGDAGATSGWQEDGSYTATASLEGSYGIEAVNERHAEWGDASLDSRAELFTGVRGEARAGGEFGLGGGSGSVAVGGFAGSEVTGSGSIGIDEIGAGIAVSGRAGIGFDAEADIDVGYDEVTIGIKVGGAIGIGAAIKPTIRFSPRAIAEHLPKFW